jgi:hypothetical protein
MFSFSVFQFILGFYTLALEVMEMVSFGFGLQTHTHTPYKKHIEIMVVKMKTLQPARFFQCLQGKDYY